MTGSAAPQKATILIVDDEPFNVDYLQQLLSDLGFRTREAFGGKEALDSVADDAPDLILLDVMMPGMDGPGVLMKLREIPATRGIPVIFMTAKVMKEEIQRFLEMGAVAVIHKPFDPERLPDQIREIWDKNNDE